REFAARLLPVGFPPTIDAKGECDSAGVDGIIKRFVAVPDLMPLASEPTVAQPDHPKLFGYQLLDPLVGGSVGEKYIAVRIGLAIDGLVFLQVAEQLELQHGGRSEERRVGKECRSRWLPYECERKGKRYH